MDNSNVDNNYCIYEVGFHLLPAADEAKVFETTEAIKNHIKNNEGRVLSEEAPRLTGLSYPIANHTVAPGEKFEKAYFGWIKFEILPENFAKLHELLKADKQILRLFVGQAPKSNNVHFHKIAVAKREEKPVVSTQEPEEVKKISEEDIDKSIDELLIN